MLLATSSQIREADRIQISEHHFPGILLMEEAGRLATEAILSSYPDRNEFLILVGPGNNGGDGLVIARHLFLKKKRVAIVLSHTPDRYTGDARINYHILNELPIPQLQWEACDIAVELKTWNQDLVLIDTLLGTGIDKQLRSPILDIVEYFRKEDFDTVAIDLPSGLDASSGRIPNEPIPAQYTFTFQLAKICNVVYPAAAYCGEVNVLDIGLWPKVISRLGIQRELLSDAFLHTHYRTRSQNTHKGSFGHILVIGGSKTYAGAIAMTGFAALKAGAGLVSVFCPESCRHICNGLSPELMVKTGRNPNMLIEEDFEEIKELLAKVDALVIGPGMGQAIESLLFLKKLLSQINIPSIWDADALNLLASHPTSLQNLPDAAVLTPHPGEMERLWRAQDTDSTDSTDSNLPIKTHRLESAESLAQQLGCTLVLKGAGSIISSPDGKSYVNTSGNPGMATAGSGDILSGIIGALLGQGYEASIAAALGVYLHGKAGDKAALKYGEESMLATDIAKELRFR